MMIQVNDYESKVLTFSNHKNKDTLTANLYVLPECCIFVYTSDIGNVYTRTSYRIYENKEQLNHAYQKLIKKFDITTVGELTSLRALYDKNNTSLKQLKTGLRAILDQYVRDTYTDDIYPMFAYLVYNCRCFDIKGVNYGDVSKILKQPDSDIREMCYRMVLLIRSSINILE